MRSAFFLPRITLGNLDATTAASPLPTRPIALAITLYILLCFVLCFPAYETFAGGLYIPQHKSELGKYIANRLGTFAAANIPIVWFFAARNSPLAWWTAWPYAAFSQFHRWSARLTAVLAISHGVTYSVVDWYRGIYLTAWSRDFWRWGVVVSLPMLHKRKLFGGCAGRMRELVGR